MRIKVLYTIYFVSLSLHGFNGPIDSKFKIALDFPAKYCLMVSNNLCSAVEVSNKDAQFFWQDFQISEVLSGKDNDRLFSFQAIRNENLLPGLATMELRNQTFELSGTYDNEGTMNKIVFYSYSSLGVNYRICSGFSPDNNSKGLFPGLEKQDNILCNSFHPDVLTSPRYSNTSDSAAESMIATDQLADLPAKFLKKVNNKIFSLRSQLDKQSKNYINKLLKQESSLKEQFRRVDSNQANNIFSINAEKEYSLMLSRMKADSASSMSRNISGEYYPYIDSLQTILSYLSQNLQLLNTSKVAPEDLESTLKNLMVLQSKMQGADQIKQFIQQRKEQIKTYLSQFTNLPSGIMKGFQNYNKQLYYYAAQVKEYKEALNDPDKLMKLTLTLLNKVPAFTNFFARYSILASIFNLSGSYDPSLTGQGLSTRNQVLASFQNQLTTAWGPNASSLVQQKVQSAEGVVDQLRDKLKSYGNNGGADIDLPNFHPNDQKTKSFLKRLQVGTDIQTVHSTYFFPATTDFGISLGYKIDSKNDVGIGASFKMGWGKGFNHINMTSQGAGLRSFADINIKKSFYATGGFEYNYQPLLDPANFPMVKSWQQSGLVGISKKISLGSKFLKSMKTQLLWDFLSYQQIPRTQPLKFRVGYSF